MIANTEATGGKVIDLMQALKDSLAATASKTFPAPAPGVYENVPMSVYLAWDAVSNSQLQQLRRSPAHYKAYIEQGSEDTPATLLGRAIHCAILEPDEFETRYVRGAIGDRRTKAVKAAWDALEAQFGAEFVLTVENYEKCLSIREAVYDHPASMALLKGAGRHELSIVWVDKETGLTCKARLDRHVTEIAGGFIADLKSTRDARPEPFGKSVEEHGYDVAAAHYLAGAKAVGLDALHFSHIALEKEAPFAVGCYRLIDAAIEVGEERRRELLRLLARCKRRNRWPALSPEIVDLTLPDYAWSRASDEIKALRAVAV
jgi:exodeoxyribonuclease VIII